MTTLAIRWVVLSYCVSIWASLVLYLSVIL